MAEGEVEIELGGNTEKLRPTLRAAKVINALGGIDGFSGVFRRIIALDLETVTAVIAAGTNKKFDKVEQDVFKAGVANLVKPASEFVSMLANGGKPLEQASESDEAGES